MNDEFLCDIETNFTMIPNEIWNYGLKPNELAVLFRIFRRASGKSGTCFESRKSIALGCSMSVKTVDRVFEELENLNIIQRESRKDDGKPNLIRIKALAHWSSKRTNSPNGGRGCVTESQGGASQSRTGCVTESHIRIYHEVNPIEVDPLNTLTTDKPVVPRENGAPIFEAYREAYERRYRVEPIRNAKVNSICSQIVKQVGVHEGKAVMHFYLQQNVAWYIQKGHAIEYALKDLQALRTNMLNNKSMSSREAQQADKQQAQKNVLDDYLANRDEYQNMFK